MIYNKRNLKGVLIDTVKIRNNKHLIILEQIKLLKQNYDGKNITVKDVVIRPPKNQNFLEVVE